MTLLVEPGSYDVGDRPVASRSRGAACAGAVVGGAVDRGHREDVAGLHVDDDRDAARAFIASTPCEQRLLGVPLQRRVDREHDVLAALGRRHLTLAAGDVVALRVALDLHARPACR